MPSLQGYEGFGPYAPPPQAPGSGGYEAFGEYSPPASGPPTREIGPGEAAGRGAIEGASFGFSPALSGVAAASGTPTPKTIAGRSSAAAARRPLAGALNILREALGIDHGDMATEAYRAERDRQRTENEQAFEQHPYAYVGGQVGGALAAPLGAVKGATARARIGSAAKSGAVAGALGGAGEAVSQGEDPLDVAISAGKGAGVGGVFGGAGGAVLEGGATAVNRARNIGRGIVNPDKEAARGILGAMREDAEATGGLNIDRGAYEAAQRAGMPVSLLDVGGQTTRDLGRASANISPQAMGALDKFTTERTEGRPERISGVINRLFGGGLDAKADQEALKAQSRILNKPRYDSAYRLGDRPIWSPKLEQLASASPSIQRAMRTAIDTGRDRAALDGFGAFNPAVKVAPDGQIVFGKTASGSPIYPNLQYWDYVQRDLKDMATRVEGRENDKAAFLNGLHHELNAELDRIVPSFQSARQGAHAFFAAEDASEAGRKFVRMDADPREARRAIGTMNPADRELFARGFADELGQGVLRNANTWSTIKRAFTTPLAKQKIETAMGGPRARELEALLRAEAVAQKSQEALGNSTTARQQELIRAFKAAGHIGGHGAGAAGAVGAFEFLKDSDYDPKSIIAAAVLGGLVRGGAHKVDTRVARRIGEMLTSQDPTILRNGASAVAHSQKLFDALRRGTEAGARIIARDIGPDRTLAGSAAILSDLLQEEEHHHHGHPDENITQPVGQ